MEVYRGEETIDGPSVGFYAVLDQSKPVVLNFWTGLCPPCRAQTPDFQRLYDADGDKFIMLEVDVGLYVGLGTQTRCPGLSGRVRYHLPYGEAYHIPSPSRFYGLHRMPTTMFITSER
jgi:thiol-disulfide isomerase/thioredoxin